MMHANTTPTLPEVYDSAALRHWHDANALIKQNRLAGADHHVGIAAECVVKHALVASGIAIPLPKKPVNYKQHIDKLWAVACTGIDAAGFADLYCLLSSASNPFAHWKIDNRYAETSALETDIATMENGKPRWQQRRDVTAQLLQYTGLIP